MGIHTVCDLYPTLLILYLISQRVHTQITLFHSEVKPYLPNFEETGRIEYAYTSPIVDPDSTDMRCGRDASVSFTNPKTAVVRAGDTVGFALGPIYYPVRRITYHTSFPLLGTLVFNN